jgi:hypothetical protein
MKASEQRKMQLVFSVQAHAADEQSVYDLPPQHRCRAIFSPLPSLAPLKKSSGQRR